MTGALLIATLVLGHAVAAGQYPLLHSHNDYNRDRPLLDALAHRFDSVEADVFLVQGRLLVAHTKKKLDPSRTLESMYLAPLAELHRLGFLQAGRRTLTLVVQIHQPALDTYRALEAELRRHPQLLSVFKDDSTSIPGAVRVLLTGEFPRKEVLAQRLRFVQVEGSLRDLDSDASPEVMPIINVEWKDVVEPEARWLFQKNETGRLTKVVQRVAARGRLVRVWGHPDNEHAWRALLDAGVKVLGTDHLTRVNRFLHR